MTADPFSLFAGWLTEAGKCGLAEPTACALATAAGVGLIVLIALASKMPGEGPLL